MTFPLRYIFHTLTCQGKVGSKLEYVASTCSVVPPAVLVPAVVRPKSTLLWAVREEDVEVDCK